MLGPAQLLDDQGSGQFVTAVQYDTILADLPNPKVTHEHRRFDQVEAFLECTFGDIDNPRPALSEQRWIRPLAAEHGVKLDRQIPILKNHRCARIVLVYQSPIPGWLAVWPETLHPLHQPVEWYAHLDEFVTDLVVHPLPLWSGLNGVQVVDLLEWLTSRHQVECRLVLHQKLFDEIVGL